MNDEDYRRTLLKANAMVLRLTDNMAGSNNLFNQEETGLLLWLLNQANEAAHKHEMAATIARDAARYQFLRSEHVTLFDFEELIDEDIQVFQHGAPEGIFEAIMVHKSGGDLEEAMEQDLDFAVDYNMAKQEEWKKALKDAQGADPGSTDVSH